MTVPGIGPIATVATIGSGDMFAKGRDFGHDPHRRYRAVVVASEPISQED